MILMSQWLFQVLTYKFIVELMKIQFIMLLENPNWKQTHNIHSTSH